MKVKYAEDYYDKIKERYPDLEMWEIDKIIKHGFQTWFTLNSYGADMLIKSGKFSLICGKLFKTKQLAIKYNTVKQRIKLRLKYKFKQPIWDGYYYFGMTEEDYKRYFPNKKKGRIKNKITFDKIYAYKIEEEAYLSYNYKYFFKLKTDCDTGLVFKAENYSTRNIELIAIRNKENKIEYIYE